METKTDNMFLIRVNRAVAGLRAIRALPKTEGTERAQRKILNRLNVAETTETAMRLSLLEDADADRKAAAASCCLQEQGDQL
jgi:hypothetical protein